MKSEESVVIYKSWFECLKAQGEKKFIKGMEALMEYSFYGKDIKDNNIPDSLEKILYTFTPIIDKNRMNRENGMKGAAFGIKGGRPTQKADSKTPVGILVSNPGGDNAPIPTVTETNTENKTVSVSETAEGETDHPPTAHKDFRFFTHVFFFRNVQHPEAQAKKFVEYYTATNWKLRGGEYLATDEQRLAQAMRWEIRDSSSDRFKTDDLEMWHKLFEIAPGEIKYQMLADFIQFNKKEQVVQIKCSTAIQEWIENNLKQTAPIVRPWLGDRKLTYSVV